MRLNNKEGLIMLSKNNYNEKLRKRELQARQDHFSIRKLTIGAASVLLGFTFFGAGSQTVKADTEATAQHAVDKTETISCNSPANDNVITLGFKKNTETDGDKKGATNTCAVPKSVSNNTASDVQANAAKKADTDQDAKNDLTKDHLKKDGSDQNDIESVQNNRKSDIKSTIETAQIRVNKAYGSSSKDQDDLDTKNDYLAQIDKIDTDVIAKLNAGKNVEEIDSTAETAIRDILNLAAAAELHFAQKKATNAITSKANVDEQAKLAASKANSHANINSAANAAKNQILEAYSKLNTTNRTETGKKCVAALDDIEATATEANDQIDKADDANSITNIVKTAVDKFFKTVDKAKIAFATALAKDLVGEGADKVSDSLSSQADKDLVNEILSQADTDFATADSLQKVFEITSKAIRDIDAVKSDALNKLNQYKLAASKKLGDVQFCDNEDIDGLPNISAENKSALKDKVNLYYQTAISNIENAVDFDQVDKEENAGHLNMGRVVVDAQNLNKKIASDQKQLDDHTQKATENINNSNLSEADKEKAIEAIGQARDDAKNIVGQQPTVERADAAEKAGEATIDAIEQAAYLTDLERAKLIEKIRVENAAENAKNKVEDEFNHLDTNGLDKEKDKLETALETIEKVKNDAETAVSSATDKNAVSTISKTGIDKINGVADDTSLEFAKEAAKEIIQQISDIVKQNLKDPKDRNAVDEIIKETTVDWAKTIHDVTKIREYIIDEIKQIKNAADNKENNDLSNAKSSSKDTVNVDASAALDRVKKAYEKLTEAERTAKKDEYDTAIKAINDARTAAEDKIDNATNVDAIIAAVSNAKQNFNTIATNAEVSFAKLAGKDKIQDAAAQANKVLSPKGQAAVKEIVTQANSDIEDAETVAKIEKITENAINKIKALQDSEKTDLENAIRYANDEFEKKYKAAVARLKKEFTDSATITEVDKAFNSNKDITGKSVEEVNAKEIAAERELAKGEVRDTGTNAKTRVDSLKHKDDTDYTDNEKKALKNQIEKDVLEANGSKDQSGTLDKPSDTEGIDTVRNDAVNKIISEAIADSQEGENVLQHDPDVLLERLAKAHKAAIDKLQKFGPTVNHDQTDKEL